jgi:DNA-binding winged helix-turn-helix (wHTH) protein
MAIRFDDYELDVERRLLTRGGAPVALTRKTFDLLALLVAERPRALSKQQVRDRVWPLTVVSESTVNSLLAELRAQLGDDAREPRYIRTVHGFGYAFAAEAQADLPPPAASADGAGESAGFLTARLLWESRLIPLVRGENLIGRDEDVSVRIDAPSVSRHHARLTVVSGSPSTLEDLGSKNGTWVAGRRLAKDAAPLRDGDVLRLGKVELVFLDSKQKGSTATAVD